MITCDVCVQYLFSEVGSVVILLSCCNHLLQLHPELLRVLTSLHLHPCELPCKLLMKIRSLLSFVRWVINHLGPFNSPVVSMLALLGLMIIWTLVFIALKVAQLLGFLDRVKLLVVFSRCIVKMMKVF